MARICASMRRAIKARTKEALKKKEVVNGINTQQTPISHQTNT